ncbi:hypothetical protein QJS04_geneDACA024251 [Acorus gramineus]|uniref:At4g15545-like C-terminal domain-containing protein n=1 Tax=Acorus gramineus TaxID=55184 RepID=A0AAV9BNP5_ACOGR|nr:hypothetical protein QJS04_geneDACA024251 [Acorus gramineus]
MTSGLPDFHLPDEILSVIPTDPYEQLDLARKITSMAIASRVSCLEVETGRLRQRAAEKDRLVDELRGRVGQLERALSEADARLSDALEENGKLSSERDALAVGSKKMSRDLAKLKKAEEMPIARVTINNPLLETFKRQLMQSLNDDNPSQARTIDIGTYDKLIAKGSSLEDERLVVHTAENSVSGVTEVLYSNHDVSRKPGQRISPYITPRLTPTISPKMTSTAISPKGTSTVGSPRFASSVTSPTKPCIDAPISMSPWLSSSQQSSAASSPPRGHTLTARTPRIDGKEFFRQARSRLSYEQFGAFLANIKEFNAQRQPREGFKFVDEDDEGFRIFIEMVKMKVVSSKKSSLFTHSRVKIGKATKSTKSPSKK